MQKYTEYTLRFVYVPYEEHLGACIDDTCYAFLLLRTGFELFPKLQTLEMQDVLHSNCREFLHRILHKRDVSRVAFVAGDQARLDDICQQLASRPAHNLKALALTLRFQFPSTLFETLSRMVGLEELSITFKEFRFHGDGMPPLVDQILAQDFSSMEPILQLRNITRFTLGWPFKVESAGVARIAQAWPRLRSLKLDTGALDHGTEPPSELRVQDLAPLIAHCKNLVELSVHLQSSFDTAVVEDVGTDVGRSVGPGLQTVQRFRSIEKSYLSDDDYELLKEMFPQAQIEGVRKVTLPAAGTDIEAIAWMHFVTGSSCVEFGLIG